uniref:Uncharacterized protein n=1 Tax=Salix viminalis TaxID=40686 RepID=A0A6N2NEM3_SALVM
MFKKAIEAKSTEALWQPEKAQTNIRDRFPRPPTPILMLCSLPKSSFFLAGDHGCKSSWEFPSPIAVGSYHYETAEALRLVCVESLKDNSLLSGLTWLVYLSIGGIIFVILTMLEESSAGSQLRDIMCQMQDPVFLSSARFLIHVKVLVILPNHENDGVDGQRSSGTCHIRLSSHFKHNLILIL